MGSRLISSRAYFEERWFLLHHRGQSSVSDLSLPRPTHQHLVQPSRPRFAHFRLVVTVQPPPNFHCLWQHLRPSLHQKDEGRALTNLAEWYHLATVRHWAMALLWFQSLVWQLTVHFAGQRADLGEPCADFEHHLHLIHYLSGHYLLSPTFVIFGMALWVCRLSIGFWRRHPPRRPYKRCCTISYVGHRLSPVAALSTAVERIHYA